MFLPIRPPEHSNLLASRKSIFHICFFCCTFDHLTRHCVLPRSPGSCESFVKSRMASLRGRLWHHLKKLIHNVQLIWKQIITIARDPVQIWNLAFRVIFKLDSSLFILPITLSMNEGGMRAFTIPTNPCRLFMPYALNLAIGIRICYLLSITFDTHFRWLVQGQFTADASLLVLVVFVASELQAIHLTFLEHREDFAFLQNSVFKLNVGYSGMYLFFQTCD